MHHKPARSTVRHALIAAAVGTLAACSQGTLPASEAPRFEHITTVDVPANADRGSIEKQYGGTAVVWRPEDGFAVIGLTDANRVKGMAVGTYSSNVNAMSVPEAGGWSAWGGGWSAWGGGWSAWGGGWSAWGGGAQANNTFDENRSAWELIKLPQAYRLAPNLGDGVKVAVIDSGIDLSHPAFQGKLVPGKDFVDGDNTPQEAGSVGQAGYGHGTSVAGIVLQVAPKAKIMPLRVLDADGRGDTDRVAQAMNWAITNGARVINLSLGTLNDLSYDANQDALRRMLGVARDRNVFVVASTGNTGDTRVTAPAKYAREYPNLVSVSSVGSSGAKSPFATYGGSLELVAPGERIFGPAPGGQRSFWSGTSMATPVVTGVLTLALGQTLTDPYGLGNQITNFAQQNEARNKNAGTPHQDQLGQGYPNAEAFLQQVVLR